MKLITSNKLNRFWKNGVLPIKNALTSKLESNKVLKTKESILANTNSSNVAGAVPVKELINNTPQFIYDSSGKITGYKTSGGADTVFPFSGSHEIKATAGYAHIGDSISTSTLQIKIYVDGVSVVTKNGTTSVAASTTV